MKKRYSILILLAVMFIVFPGCQRMLSPDQPMPEQQGNTENNISSAKDKSDSYYVVVTNNVRAQSGMNGSTAITYNLPVGSKVKVMGKYDVYYLVVLPNNQMGLIPINSTKPASPAQSKPIPTPANQTGPTPAAQPGIPPAGRTETTDSEMTALVNLVNQARSQAGLGDLGTNSELNKLAGLKASDIANNNYFSHNSPTYGSPFDMMRTYGVSYLNAGENLAINRNVQGAHQALMNSPTHKANILNSNFTDIGIGIAPKSDGSKVYVQMFISK